jgi:hypothetical protein
MKQKILPIASHGYISEFTFILLRYEEENQRN